MTHILLTPFEARKIVVLRTNVKNQNKSNRIFSLGNKIPSSLNLFFTFSQKSTNFSFRLLWAKLGFHWYFLCNNFVQSVRLHFFRRNLPRKPFYDPLIWYLTIFIGKILLSCKMLTDNIKGVRSREVTKCYLLIDSN